MKKTVTKRMLFACGCALVALANWPLINLINRVEPFVLGLPFFIFVMLVIHVLVVLLLFVAYKTTD